VFPAPFSSDQPAQAAAAVGHSAGFSRAGVSTERPWALAAEGTPHEHKEPSQRGGGALGRPAVAGRCCFSESTPLAPPYSDFYQPHQRFRAELGK